MSQIPIVENDLSSFFIDGEFAQPVQVNGVIFDAIITDYYAALDGGEVGIESTEILLICETSKLPMIAHGDPVQVKNENFIIVNIRPDNSGVTRLQLTRTSLDPILPGEVTYNGESVTYLGENVTYGII